MKVFLNGIAGTGMSSLAGLFRQKGFDVLGSDSDFYPPVDSILKQMKATLFRPYHEKNIPKEVDFCIIGNVISRGNPEAEYILNNKITYYSMADALYKFFIKGKNSVVVSGTHGKTTITSFISHLLDYAGLEPGFFVGGKPLNFSSNYSKGNGRFFVVEGDEYETSFFDRSSKFLKYFPDYLIISALEYDHLDFFPSEELYKKSFMNLVNQVPSKGLIIINNDYSMNQEVVAKAFTPVVSYGTKNSDFVIMDIQSNKSRGGYTFSLKHKSQKSSFQTILSGKYNIWNLSSGIILGYHLGIPEKVIKEGVFTFKGVERRLNIIKKIKNSIYIEDFAHHPTSIQQVLESLKEIYPEKRIYTFFEPRSWSLRRNFFQNRLVDSFLSSDEIIIKDVYEKEKIPKKDRLKVNKIKEELEKKGKKVFVYDEYQGIKEFLKRNINLEKNNLVLIISNGSFGNIPAFIKNLD
jgi:UDP-N-acetylmuramate: L-alanyl-gamma-D-glutamyl-meso-diaminopimelate ligase